jgi:hypothetical protein
MRKNVPFETDTKAALIGAISGEELAFKHSEFSPSTFKQTRGIQQKRLFVKKFAAGRSEAETYYRRSVNHTTGPSCSVGCRQVL